MSASKYNKSKIMSNAHQLYKNARSKYPTFSDALRKAWSMEKFSVRIKEGSQAIDERKRMHEEAEQERREQAAISSILFDAEQKAARIRQKAEEKVGRMRLAIEARKAGMPYDSYVNNIAKSMGYGCGTYCGD